MTIFHHRLHFSSMRLGILGGGQLARMLALAALEMGIQPIVFTQRRTDPAAQVCPEMVLGELTDSSALDGFLTKVSAVIFENEFIDTKLLEQAFSRNPKFSREEDRAFRVQPSLQALSRLQDKLNQKHLLKSLGIPTSEFFQVGSTEEVSSLLKQIPEGLVLKWARLGYDGKGVLILPPAAKGLAAEESPESRSQVFAEIQSFLEKAKAIASPVYAERRVSFKRELAMIGVRAATGEFSTYPLVISEQKQGICFKVVGPACEMGVNPNLEARAQFYLRLIAEDMELVGSFAVEFFETQDGELLVNEIAPRVHNSGHYSQNASMTDQFQNHIRAALGFPLGSTRTNSCFLMQNLLGPDHLGGCSLDSAKVQLPVPKANTFIHWYGKSSISSHRKMGHINGVVRDVQDLAKLVREVEEVHSSWIEHVKGSE